MQSGTVARVSCSCCGRDRPAAVVGRRDDVRLCRECVDALAAKLGVTSTPTLPVADLAEAVSYYERAGFGVRIHRGADGDPGDGFAFVDRDGASVFDLDATDVDIASNRAGCYLVVPDADEWHHRLRDAGLDVTAIADEPWGMREFALTDPSGNRIRIGHGLG
jgi:catechol 2,3-dioxygenase-like lactoylglutathione lyase family enzyme/ribosomal protein S14